MPATGARPTLLNLKKYARYMNANVWIADVAKKNCVFPTLTAEFNLL